MGVDWLPVGRPVELTVPPATRLASRPSLITVVRSVLRPEDIVPFVGPPTTSPARTAFDLASRSPRLDAVVAVDALLHRRAVTMGQLAAVRCAFRPCWIWWSR
jgi:hypothetical protein